MAEDVDVGPQARDPPPERLGARDGREVGRGHEALLRQQLEEGQEVREGEHDRARAPLLAGVVVAPEAPSQGGELRVVERVEEGGQRVPAVVQSQGIEIGRPAAGLEVSVDPSRVGVEGRDGRFRVEGSAVPGEDRDLNW